MNESQSESQSHQELNISSQQTNNEPTHFDFLIQDAPDVEPVNFEEGANVSENINMGMLSKEHFIKTYCTGFNFTSAMTGFESLKCDEADPKVIEAFSTLYETAQDVPMLHFMLKPSGKWMGRAFVLGTFFGGMAVNVSKEMKPKQPKAKTATKAAKKEEVKEAAPSYDGAPTEDQLATLTGGAA